LNVAPAFAPYSSQYIAKIAYVQHAMLVEKS